MSDICRYRAALAAKNGKLSDSKKIPSCGCKLGRVGILGQLQQNMWRRGGICQLVTINRVRIISSSLHSFMHRCRVDLEIATKPNMVGAQQSVQLQRQNLKHATPTDAVS